MSASVEGVPTDGNPKDLRSTVRKVSVVLPCLDEAENIECCVTLAHRVLNDANIDGEVIVVDNNSSDGSGEIAANAGATVIHERRPGYGSAYLAGLEAARGEYIVMLDADLTYDFNDIPRFLASMEDGAEMVIGDRMDNIKPGAMRIHRRVGNWLLTGILNLLFDTGVRDAHCGMRALRADVLERLDLRTTGMEFASEMVIRADKEKLRITQIPIKYSPRGGESKLLSFRDGPRHLRHMLLESPYHLFLLPGAVLVVPGGVVSAMALAHIEVLGWRPELSALVASSLVLILGAQILAFGLCAHAHRLSLAGSVRGHWYEHMRMRLRLKHGLLFGLCVALVGMAIAIVLALQCLNHGFETLAQERAAIAAGTLLVLGIQIAFSSCLLTILGFRRTSP